MDFWKSEYEEGENTSVLAGLQDYFDSPSVSSINSVEYSSDSFASDPIDPIDPNELSRGRLTPKSALLAKRRLQAYSAVKFKLGNLKEEKNDSVPIEKTSKPIFKKNKKTYPDDSAKAVIRDIEILKKAGYGYGLKAPPLVLPSNINIPSEPLVPISLISHVQCDSPSAVSVATDLDDFNTFKKREIKCRNIRKSDTYHRRSTSPKDRGKKADSHKKDKCKYPSNWTEYKEQGLDFKKDALLKSKLLKNAKDKKFDFKGYFNFQTPPLPIEIYKGQSKGGDTNWIPFPILRYTASKPQLVYSTNQQVASPGYLTREQLFALIPRERRLAIEKLGRLSRCELDDKPLKVRKWYPRNWKKTDNSEAKLLEKSVGLSFLQSYSDEEGDETFDEGSQRTVIEKDIDLSEAKKDDYFVKQEQEIHCTEETVNLLQEHEEFTPSATPKATNSLMENDDMLDLNTVITTKKSRWEGPVETTEQMMNNDISNYDKTPPIDEKEEGEVLSDEDPEIKITTHVGKDEYEQTKEELEALEAVLKCSTNYLENVSVATEMVTEPVATEVVTEPLAIEVITEPVATKSEKKKKDKKKRKKIRGDKISSKSKSSKKKSKKKTEKKEKDDNSSSSDFSESEEEETKKKKQKKKRMDSKSKSEKGKKRKAKKKKLKKKKAVVPESEEDLEGDTSLKNTSSKKKKKQKKVSEKKRRTSSGDLGIKILDVKTDSGQENYDDDMRFFAARFIAEDELKGKSRHKTKTNITLEDLTTHQKIEDKIQKRKTTSESDEVLLSESGGRKKIEHKCREETAKKCKDKVSEETLKKDDIKVDLLKMNENYLREQKQKEEGGGSFLIKEDDSTLNKSTVEHHPDLKRGSRSLSREKSKEKIKAHKKTHKEATKDCGDKYATTAITEADRSHDDEIKSNKNITEEPIIEEVVKKRKRRRSEIEKLENLDKKSRNNISNDPVAVSVVESSPELIKLADIKKEKDTSDVDSESLKVSSWESDEEILDDQVSQNNSFELEIPLNIKPFSRREIKVEKGILLKEQLQKLPVPLPTEIMPMRKEIMDTNQFDIELNQSQLNDKSKSELSTSTKRNKDMDSLEFESEVHTPTKKRRWDIKGTASTPIIKLEKPNEIIIDLEDGNSSNNCVTLEDEYEEFMKAVTSAKKDSGCKSDLTETIIIIDSTSDNSVTLGQDSKVKKELLKAAGSNVNDFSATNKTLGKTLIKHVEESNHLKPVLDLSTIQIPLPPSSGQIKPVPVPSPKLNAIIDLDKPLINLSVSANLTQNITLSLATSLPSISTPITTSLDISKSSVEILTPLSADTLVSMSSIPLPLSQTVCARAVSEVKLSHIPIPSNHNILETDRPSNIVPIITTDIIVPPKVEIGKNQAITLTLPSKKLLDNSKLNLDDSDNDDQDVVEEMKRRKLEALIEDNKREVLGELPLKVPPVVGIEKNIAAEKPIRVKSPIVSKPSAVKKDDDSRKTNSTSAARRAETSPRRSTRQPSPGNRRNRDSPTRRREPSPRRRSSPSRRKSPKRSPKRRSPVRRKKSPGGRKSPGRRISISPRRRRGGSNSPRRRRSSSPRRKPSPAAKGRHSSPRRNNRSPSPPRNKRTSGTSSKESRSDPSFSQNKSRGRTKSPMNPRGTSPLQRSVADSTISDDQLPQQGSHDSCGHVPPIKHQQEKNIGFDSPKRVPLDERISQVLGYPEPSNQVSQNPTPHSANSSFYHNEIMQQYQEHYHFAEHQQYSSIQSQVTTPTMRAPQSTYRQVGNMLQIVPTTENLIETHIPYKNDFSSMGYRSTEELNPAARPSIVDFKPKILQVGNMLQIVPTDMVVPTEMIPVPPIHTEIKTEKTEEPWVEPVVGTQPNAAEKQSAEASMLLKVAERRAERENRRQVRERRRKDKEKRRKEKEKTRQAKMKAKTEDMIKRALELEEEEAAAAESDALGDQSIQWPPIPIVVNHSVFKEVGKSILINSGARIFDESFTDERRIKNVQFADGIRPGEGTSPSAGEDLSSPPPPQKKMPKEKRFKKIKFGKKSAKKKVKVKIIKKPPSPSVESDSSDDILPPPSPPPGSPPPHVFPPRIKIKAVNNVPAAYLASIIQNAQQQQQQLQQSQQQYQPNLYRSSLNMMMAPPPLPQSHHHLSSVPSHAHSPHGSMAMPPSPQTHYHPGLTVPPPPPPLPPHSGHTRHY